MNRRMNKRMSRRWLLCTSGAADEGDSGGIGGRRNSRKKRREHGGMERGMNGTVRCRRND